MQKEPQLNHAQNRKIYISNIYREYLLYLQSNASGSFSQTCIRFAEQRLKFSHFEGSIPSYWFHIQQENAMRYNNRDDLLQLSFTLKISIFSKVYI